MKLIFCRSPVTRQCLGLVAMCIVAPDAAAEEQPVQGIVADRPAAGRYVALDDGYMVAYSEQIPGSDVRFEMLPVPGGEFLLGSPPGEADRREDEGPQVRITLPPFWIGKYEVTWAEYREYMALTNAFDKFNDLGMRQVSEDQLVDAVTAPSKLYDPTFTFASGEEPQLPAVSMSQYAAKQYSKWLSLLTTRFYRLPTEAEWEYACRAGTTTAYSFGDDPALLDDYAWYYDNSDDATHPVGQKEPNDWGLYDMHGNTEEWVLDAYDPAHYQRLSVRDGPLAREEAIDWPKKLFPRVLRGGSWDDDADRLRSAARGQSDDDLWREYDPNSPKSPWWFASDSAQDVGFRLVRPLEPPEVDQRARYWDADVPSIQRTADFRIDEEGRGERGLVDPELPKAIEGLSD